MENLAAADGGGRAEKSRLLINTVSAAVPVAVGLMLAFPNKLSLGEWTKTLPHFIGAINSLTTAVLIAGWIFIKRNRPELHRLAMLAAFGLGGLFLICYVAYHVSNPANKFGGSGGVRYLYFFLLATHVLLSIAVLPLVLRSLFFALTGQFARHKRVVKYAYPVWLYVSASGVLVYLLLYQLFPRN